MSVFKRDGKWYIKGKIKKDDGSYYQYTKLAKGCRLQRDATEYERLFRVQYQDIRVSDRNKTFEDVALEMMEDETSIKSSTKKSNIERLNKVYPFIGDKKINLITKDHLQKMIRDFEKDYSESYVEAIYSAVNKVFKYAVFKDYIQVNQLSKVKRTIDKDTVKEEKQFWEPKQFELFIKEVNEQDMKAFFTFLFWMGTRRGETLALQWKDIDFNTNTVSIHKTTTRRVEGRIWAITTPKTKNSIRNITMPEVVINELKALKEVQEQMYGYNEDVYLFGYHRPMPDDYPRRYLVKTVKALNEISRETLKQITIHEFRHSHASYLINNMSDKFTVYDIAKRLGDTVETVLETYAHQFKNADRKLSDFINQDNAQENKPIQSSDKKYSELIELKQLLDMGVITQSDFDVKKKAILGI
ncbi:MAG: tyrosine-type recombinase/integrase [Erysipelotrichaceae bacterium]|nr:tyrosine-type recombinase/integrase [Erysipelotrichaceae bacterium]